MSPLFIVDGYSILFRTYYSVGEMATSQNIPVGGVFGFVRAIFSLILRHNVQNIIITLDSGKKTFRSDIFAQYKANRVAVPETLIPQFGILDEFLTTASIAHFRKDGYEADDIIASIIKNEPNRETIIVTSDKDLMQLVSKNTRCLDFFANKFYTIDDVVLKFGVKPQFIVDYLAIIGDTSDNVPGIKGCGPKAAVNLIQKFGTIEEIIANITNIENPRIKEIISKNIEIALLSKQLVTLDSGIELSNTCYETTGINHGGIMNFVEKYEMNSLKYLALKLSGNTANTQAQPVAQGELF